MARLAPYDLWAADYRSKAQLDAQIGRSYGMWQYIGGEGSCPGVTGPCDRNYAYKDYPAIIRQAGLNGFSKAATPPTKPAETQTDELARIRAELTASKEYTAACLIKQIATVTTERDTYKNRCERAARLLTT